MAHLVTSHQGEDHVTSANDAHLHAGQIGNGQYAFKGRGNLACSMINTNTLRIMSGDAQCNGYHWEIPGDYEEVTIENGSPGNKRIDLVVADITTAPKEECSIVVIKGEEIDERAGEPTVPSHIEGDLRAGDTHVQMPICSVQINGVNTDKPQMLMDFLVPYAEFRDSQSRDPEKDIEYLDNGWTIKLSHLGLSLYSLRCVKTFSSGISSIHGGNVTDSLPLSVPFDVNLSVTNLVGEVVVGYGKASINNRSIRLSTTGYDNAVSVLIYGTVRAV